MKEIIFYHNNEKIKIYIEWKNNKNMYLKFENNRIVCTASNNFSIKDVNNFVNKNIDKIIKHLKQKKEFYNFEKNFIILNNKKMEIIKLVTNCKLKYKITENNVFFYLIIGSNDEMNYLLKKILLERTKLVVDAKFNDWIKNMDLKPHSYSFSYKNSNWASNMIGKNKIIFSTRIAHLDNDFIEYIIVHELAHSIEPNHQKSFWNIIEKHVPNYKEIIKQTK